MSTLPPGPERLGLIDTLRASIGSPAPVLRRLAAQHGDPFRFCSFNGPMIFTGAPRARSAPMCSA